MILSLQGRVYAIDINVVTPSLGPDYSDEEVVNAAAAILGLPITIAA